MTKEQTIKTTNKKLQVKDTVCGLYNLGVCVAEAVAAYVLYFNSTKAVSLDIVAGFLVVDAVIRAVRQFVVTK